MLPFRRLKGAILYWPIPVADSAEFLEESANFEYVITSATGFQDQPQVHYYEETYQKMTKLTLLAV